MWSLTCFFDAVFLYVWTGKSVFDSVLYVLFTHVDLGLPQNRFFATLSSQMGSKALPRLITQCSLGLLRLHPALRAAGYGPPQA